MLKIKDNVDLKELEKFGFEYREYSLESSNYRFYDFTPNNSISVIQIEITSRLIYLNDNNKYDGLSKIYDLIQAGLVEKVEDK